MPRMINGILVPDADPVQMIGPERQNPPASPLAADPSFTSRYVRLAELDSLRPVASLYLSGTTGENVSTPDSADFNPTTSLRVRVAVTLPDYTPAAIQHLVTKYGVSGQFSWMLFMNTAGTVAFGASVDGTTTPNYNNANFGTLVDGVTYAFEATWTPSAVTAHRFKVSSPETAAADIDSDTGWVAATSVTGAAQPATIFDGTAVVVLGGRDPGTTQLPMIGNLHAARIDVNGGLAARYDARIPATRYRDATGKVWTVNGTPSWDF